MVTVNEHINAIITLFDMNKYKEADDHANEALKFVTQGTKEYFLIEGMHKLCAFLIDENEEGVPLAVENGIADPYNT